ncbi:MAG TPA: hypothetical protein VMB74_02770 [Streptosporangiaceae bacterium]|nr:hypothetical protein [Streptosporangiaceae bacterium]
MSGRCWYKEERQAELADEAKDCAAINGFREQGRDPQPEQS